MIIGRPGNELTAVVLGVGTNETECFIQDEVGVGRAELVNHVRGPVETKQVLLVSLKILFD